jgi:Fe-S-cluster containining protein
VSPRVRALALHARYRCGNSGACCASGWTIPVEPQAEARIEAGLRSGALRDWHGRVPDWSRPLDAAAAKEDAPAAIRQASTAAREGDAPAPRPRVALRVLTTGACVFLDAAGSRLCAVHHRLGEEALPSACRHFPRVVTLTPLGVSVTLSHYCPTVAGLLFVPRHPEGGLLPSPEGPAVSPDPLLRIVLSPPAFPPGWPFEGLDARDALPPFLRPGVLMSWPALERWEEHAAAVLADETASPENALARLAADAEHASEWTPSAGDFDLFFARVLARPAEAIAPAALAPDAAWRLVAGCASEPLLVPAPPPPDASTLVEAGWPALSRPVRRWLGAKAFASWALLQGDGLRTAVAALATGLGVLRAECARGCAQSGRALDQGLLLEAVRRADLLLVHLADPEALARAVALRSAR